MNRRAAFILAAVVVVAATTATALALLGDEGSSVPTEAQARVALETKFRQAGDPQTFCGDTDIPEMCASQWERLGGTAAVPRTPPRIASIREQDGYRVLRVCGDDGRGQPYRSDFVVGLEDGKVAYVLPVFWNGATFSGVHGDDAPAEVDRAQARPAGDCS